MIALETDITKAHNRVLPNVITSFNEEGYKRYGEKFIESWLKYWPAGVRLTVYYEGENFPFTPGMSWVPMEDVEFLRDYLENLRFPLMHGIVGDRYDINFDARQARKAFMEMHAMRTYGGKVFWMDADTVTHANVPESFLDEMLPDDKFCCYLGRDGWYFTESGFIGFNGNHPLAGKFAKNYLHCFITGVIFSQQMWHDCAGFDAIRKVLGADSEFVNLASGVPHGTMHPQANTILAKYFYHLKGDRKDTGKLKSGDIVRAA